MDKTGLAIGLIQPGKIITTTDDVYAFEVMPGNRDWVSIIERMSMEGAILDPMVIFKGIQPIDDLLNDLPSWQYAFLHNGWSNKQLAVLALSWLTRVFIPSTKPSTEGAARLLILDANKSHQSDEFLFECL
jgi:hypothetical protein